MKWIKVYVGPGYPLDRARNEARLSRFDQFIQMSRAGFIAEFLGGPPYSVRDLDAHLPLRHWANAPLLEGGVRTPSEMPGYAEAKTKYLAHDVANMTEDQKAQLMDQLQARARQWTQRFNGQQEFSVEKKKERREAEQYLVVPPEPSV
jgi:hypothetical protein